MGIYAPGDYVDKNVLGKQLTFEDIKKRVGKLIILDKSTESTEWYMIAKVEEIHNAKYGNALVYKDSSKKRGVINELYFGENYVGLRQFAYDIKTEVQTSAALIDENINFIIEELNNTKLSFIKIGYYLKQARDSFNWEKTDYEDIWDYAQKCFKMSKSNASRYMTINDQFSVGGNSVELLPEYKEYSSSVLIEMFKLTQEERKQIKPTDTVREVRKKKAELHPSKKAKKEVENSTWDVQGQMVIDADFKEIVPEQVTSIENDKNVKTEYVENSVATSEQNLKEPDEEAYPGKMIYNDKISNCPFCGGEMSPAVMSLKGKVGERYVECYHCGSKGSVSYDYEEAIKRWNNRVVLSESKEPPSTDKKVQPELGK